MVNSKYFSRLALCSDLPRSRVRRSTATDEDYIIVILPLTFILAIISAVCACYYCPKEEENERRVRVSH